MLNIYICVISSVTLDQTWSFFLFFYVVCHAQVPVSRVLSRGKWSEVNDFPSILSFQKHPTCYIFNIFAVTPEHFKTYGRFQTCCLNHSGSYNVFDPSLLVCFRKIACLQHGLISHGNWLWQCNIDLFRAITTPDPHDCP